MILNSLIPFGSCKSNMEVLNFAPLNNKAMMLTCVKERINSTHGTPFTVSSSLRWNCNDAAFSEPDKLPDARSQPFSGGLLRIAARSQPFNFYLLCILLSYV